MAEIRPFKGIRYNQKIIKNLASVICPPYDVISAQFQEELYQRSEFNFVRIEFNRELPQDNTFDNRYSRSASNIKQWLEEGILEADDTPAIYIHQHSFSCLGKSYQRNNIIACVRLEEWDKRVIRPHENVMPKPKNDRLNMLWACQANTSPVFSLYEDSQKAISSVLSSQVNNRPLINLVDCLKEKHKIWAITDSDIINQIREAPRK